MTPPLSEEALEALWRQSEDQTFPDEGGVRIMAMRADDLRSLISEVRHLRSERSGYRQGLEDGVKDAEECVVLGYEAGDVVDRIEERIARLNVDAGQGSEHITRGVQPQGDEHAQGDEEGSGEARHEEDDS